MENKSQKIILIAPFYNPGAFLIKKCIASILTQKYDNFKVVFINDCSTDGSDGFIDKNDERIIYINNTTRKTALENIVFAILNNFEEDAIYGLIDADDSFTTRNCLSYIRNIYSYGIGGENKIIQDDELKSYPENIRETNKVLMSYGSASWSNGNCCCSRPYEKIEFENIKKHPFKVSHFRSFLGKTFSELIKQCPDMSCFKDENGEFYKSGYDTALFIPMLQICSYSHTFYNKKVLYYYNLHENNDHVLNQKLQWHVHSEALKKKDFKKIEL